MKSAIETACGLLAGLQPGTATVIRAGALGACYISSNNGGVHWVPAYWSHDQSKVVDPTGAGNGFMGGLAAALDEDLDIHQGQSRLNL